MADENASGRQAHRLLQVGSVLFLLALLVGLAVPHFAVPRLGLSTHFSASCRGPSSWFWDSCGRDLS
jgi:hypothetical protein